MMEMWKGMSQRHDRRETAERNGAGLATLPPPSRAQVSFFLRAKPTGAACPRLRPTHIHTHRQTPHSRPSTWEVVRSTPPTPRRHRWCPSSVNRLGVPPAPRCAQSPVPRCRDRSRHCGEHRTSPPPLTDDPRWERPNSRKTA